MVHVCIGIAVASEVPFFFACEGHLVNEMEKTSVPTYNYHPALVVIRAFHPMQRFISCGVCHQDAP